MMAVACSIGLRRPISSAVHQVYRFLHTGGPREVPRRGTRSWQQMEDQQSMHDIEREKMEDLSRRTMQADVKMAAFKQMSAEQLLESAKLNEPALPPEFPSDVEPLQDVRHKRDQSKLAFRPKTDPRDTSILLFPGQGAQFVGMGKNVLDFANVQEMFDMASDHLGYDLLDLCLNGPLNELSKTVHQQPAIFVTSLAAVEKLREINPSAIAHCVTAAGFSIGEYSALVFAGALSFEDGIRLVKARAEAMQHASEAAPSGLMTVFLSPSAKLGLALNTAEQYCQKRLNMERAYCRIANYLYPEVKVIGGNTEALDFVQENAKDFGIVRLKRLPVSGAFHTPLMTSAQQEFSKALAQVDLQLPIVPVHSNVDGRQHQTVKRMKKHLLRQLSHPVKWEQTMHILYARKPGIAFPQTFECGAGRQLGSVLRMTNKPAFQSYQNIGV